ncbi:hypothetical protein Q2T42_30895 [Leptolyngbya boryana CZ1]|uniref:Uncharacterized protein n=1 Tax=Leptolyngbya boryana CZ1 TaxID=3060204 RepID=A0AA96WUV5_LEPBY|nr:hypothetical protein [Leptolyngbya boryana]WNZ46200.1 hypothetical protein Q2T42_30895 [Leptolyngbya boryana CZ1]
MKLNVIRQRGLWWAISAICILASIIAMLMLQTQVGTPAVRTRLPQSRNASAPELDCSQPGNY